MRTVAVRMFCERIGGKVQAEDMEYRGAIYSDGRTLLPGAVDS